MVLRSIPLALCLALAACGEPEITVPDTMTVVALLPPHGAVDIGRDVQPLVYLSHTAASSSAVEQGFTLACLGAPVADSCVEPDDGGCTELNPEVAVTYESTEQVARMVPADLLQADTCYQLTLAAGIAAADENVGPLPVDVQSSFRTH